MALTVEERKARRDAGVVKAKAEMTAAQRIQRALTNGRPPASELRTPTAAVTAARTLHRELQTRMAAEGLNTDGGWGVSVAYISPDLSVLGFSALFAPGREAALMAMLDGQIMLGLIFGILDTGAPDGAAMGARAFIVSKQTDAWLDELLLPVKLELSDPV